MIATVRPIGISRLAARSTVRAQRAAFSVVAPSIAAAGGELKTPLYDFHVQHQAKMVPFAGWSMPLSYGDTGQTVAHQHVRTAAGLFDVSHMLQHLFTGSSSQAFLSSLCPTTISALKPHTSSLSVLLNEQGGIIDDLIITKHTDNKFYVVTNAGRATEDKAWIQAKLDEWNSTEGKGKGQEVTWERLEGWGLVALQGPKAAEVLQALTETDLSQVKFGQSTYAKVGMDGIECHIARGGYTGEDGFEVSIPPLAAIKVTQEIAANSAVKLIGLGARDSLRLEAGMCLYGNDLDETISPVEAGLSWVIGKDRRTESTANFPGQSRILSELASGPSRRRVGFEITGSPARQGCKVFNENGSEEIGIITSGIPSPTLGLNIAMGYVKNGNHKKGTKVMIEVRKKLREAVIKPMPFVPAKYFK